MKNILNKLTIVLSIVVVLSCVDESLDPFRIDQLQKGSILALRGDAFDKLNDLGCSNSFFKDNRLGTEAFTFEADFLSEDQELLQEVQTFVQIDPALPENEDLTKPRTLVASTAGTAFTIPSGANYKRGTVSITLAAIKTALSVDDTDLARLSKFDMTITSDLILTDGRTVPSSVIVNLGLFGSAIFFPAHRLVYCAIEVDDSRPIATTRLLGTVVKNAKGETTSRPVLPRRDGITADLFAIDTVLVSFNKDIIDPPTATVDVGSVSAVIPAKKTDSDGNYTSEDDPRAFWVVFTSTTGGVTGQATVTISGATALDTESGETLTQNDKTQKIEVDNSPPLNLSVTAGGSPTQGAIGRNQFITIEAEFNEALGKAPTITVTGQNLDELTSENNKMLISSTNSKVATYIYIFKDTPVPAEDPSDVIHGLMEITMVGGLDKAGNPHADIERTSTSPITEILLIDIAEPPAPSMALSSPFDFGNQVRWTITQTGAGVPVGSAEGTVTFLVLADGDPAPSQRTKLIQGNSVNDGFYANWVATTAYLEDDIVSLGDDKWKAKRDNTGVAPVAGDDWAKVTLTIGTTEIGSNVFADFLPSGARDVYFYFTSTTGNVSLISPKYDVLMSPQ